MGQEEGSGGARIRRRGFIGAGLAGASAALIAPANVAVARSAPQVAAPSAPQNGRRAASGIFFLPTKSIYPNLPGIPVDLVGIAETLVRLGIRQLQLSQAKQSLTNMYTIAGKTDVGYAFLFKDEASLAKTRGWDDVKKLVDKNPQQAVNRYLATPLRTGRVQKPPPVLGAPAPLPLDTPDQFSISWATFPDVYHSGLPRLPTWAASLTDAASATDQFWPMIAGHGFAYNLILPAKVSGANVRRVRARFKSIWTQRHDALAAAGSLYQIDMSRFQALQPQTVNGAPRFTPSTVTLLEQDPSTKALTPIAITVSGYHGQNSRTFARGRATDGAWLYALQAAKASITVFGVWLGHVYHWHLVTAAMQGTMLNTFSTNHPVYQLLSPQSKYAIPFDDVLLLLWPFIAPPTSLSDFLQFLSLWNDYGAGRSYFDDDPKVTLQALGLQQSDFTVTQPWDRYPVVQRLLAIWDLVSKYADAFVQATYSSDAAVAADTALQSWMDAASPSGDGNIQGLPKMDSRDALARVLTSLLYRVTAHGISRLNSTANPSLTFVANFPHCLQRTDIPNPNTAIDTKTLLTYLPNTETIGEAVNFYFIFVNSPPTSRSSPWTALTPTSSFLREIPAIRRSSNSGTGWRRLSTITSRRHPSAFNGRSISRRRAAARLSVASTAALREPYLAVHP